MASDENLRQLKSSLQDANKFQGKDLIHRSEWGAMNFEAAQEDMSIAFSIVSDLLQFPLEVLTDSVVNGIVSALPNVSNHLEQIDKFDLTGDPSGKRDGIVRGLRKAVENLQNQASLWIPYLAYRHGDVSANLSKLNSAVETAKTGLESSEKWVANKKDEIEKIASAAREAAARAGVAAFTEEFESESSSLETRSKDWLKAAAGLAFATIVAAILFYYWPRIPANDGPWVTLRNIASKAAIIAMLFTGTVWCGRIYRALIHQATINKHRALSLRTFQAFVEATDDPYVKDAVLMAATRSVFGTVPTGLVDHPHSQDPNVNFVEFGKSTVERAADSATSS